MKKFLLIGAVSLIVIVITGFIGIKHYGNDRNAEENYQNYCASCHGEQLRSFVNRTWIYGNSWNEVFKAIKIGYPDDGMPGYDTAFTDKEIAELTDFILTGIESLTAESFAERPDFSGEIQTEALNFKLEQVAEVDDVPWGLAFLPNNDILITERSGKFHRLDSNGKMHEIKNVPEVLARGQGGLLDVEVHPDFSNNSFIYLSYSKPSGSNATTAVTRAKLVNDQLVDPKIILEATPYLSTRHHYGSRMEFDTAGYLFVSVGERGKQNENPQNLKNHCGKIHRINDDGSIPKDNPFYNTSGAIKSIYSYGHRNPQGLTLNPETGVMWETEHGPRGGDEVNIIKGGQNYGWPVISYGINYDGTKFTDITEKEDMAQPQSYWVPSIGASGLTFITGDRYPAWKGNLLAGSLRFQYLARLTIEGDKIIKEEKLLKNIGRLRDVKLGKDGYIYIAVEDPGRVFRIVPVN